MVFISHHPILIPPTTRLLVFSVGIICNASKFGTDAYKTFGNIRHHSLSLRLEGDSDSEGTDHDATWPTARIDQPRWVVQDEEEERNKQEVAEAHVARWIMTQT
jgi:hypothetical protein